MDKFVGKRLDGRYKIEEIIGVGGMAVVYKAYDMVEDRVVAIKILKDEFASNEEFKRRFKNESKAIAVLSHPNIVKVYDVSFGDLIQYIVMEYIEGINLKEYIEKNSGLSWSEAVNFTIQILRGLQHAHDKGIVHRDVKPQNIMVLEDNTIKVTDFGIARFARNEAKTITDKAIGSVHYISPEQAKGDVTDEKADIYSVGVMLYEMLTGVLPFEAESAVSVAIMQLQTEPKLPTHINPLIPVGVEQITVKAMQKDTRNRYKSAAEMLRDLEQFKRDPAMTFDNLYFIDNEPTKYIDRPLDKKEDEEEETTKSPLIPILIGVASAFVVAIVILGIWIIKMFTGGTGVAFPCPDYVGAIYENVIAEENEYGFKFQVSSYQSSSEYEMGEIISQTPVAGKDVKKNATIKVVVSKGPEYVEVPKVDGFEAAKAQAILENAGFKVQRVEELSEVVAANLVIRTTPAGGSYMPSDTEIKMFVSSGEPTEMIDVPNVVGCTLEDAKKIIEKQGFTVGEILEVDSDAKQKNFVLEQDPTFGGEKAGKGTAINIKIGSGVRNYKVTVNVPLPDDYISQYGTVSLWINNEEVKKSNKLDIWNSKQTTFEIETQDPTVTVEIKLSHTDNKYDDYMRLVIDSATGVEQHSKTKIYAYPVVEKDSDDTDDNNNNNQQNGGSQQGGQTNNPQG